MMIDGCKGKTEKLSFGFCSGRASDNILADFILHFTQHFCWILIDIWESG